MKKLTALLFSLMMCFSLIAIPAQATFLPNPVDPIVIDIDEDSSSPSNDPDEAEISAQSKLPDERDDIPRG